MNRQLIKKQLNAKIYKLSIECVKGRRIDHFNSNFVTFQKILIQAKLSTETLRDSVFTQYKKLSQATVSIAEITNVKANNNNISLDDLLVIWLKTYHSIKSSDDWPYDSLPGAPKGTENKNEPIAMEAQPAQQDKWVWRASYKQLANHFNETVDSLKG